MSTVLRAILVSWGIALLEYCLAVPANRLGYLEFSGFQLKVIQEVVTLVVFIAFALIGMAAFIAFAFKGPAPS